MLSVVILSVIMLNAVAPFGLQAKSFTKVFDQTIRQHLQIFSTATIDKMTFDEMPAD
jgi:hypothetical protein